MAKNPIIGHKCGTCGHTQHRAVWSRVLLHGPSLPPSYECNNCRGWEEIPGLEAMTTEYEAAKSYYDITYDNSRLKAFANEFLGEWHNPVDGGGEHF